MSVIKGVNCILPFERSSSVFSHFMCTMNFKVSTVRVSRLEFYTGKVSGWYLMKILKSQSWILKPVWQSLEFMIHIPLFSGHSLAIKSQISAFEVCAWVENKIPRWLLGLKVTNQSQILPFAFSCPPLLSLFLLGVFFFFTFCWAFCWLHLGDKQFSKSF